MHFFILAQQVIINRLEYEKSLVESLEEDMNESQSTTTTTTTTSHLLLEGISYLLEELKGKKPWRATWPSLYSNNKKNSGECGSPPDSKQNNSQSQMHHHTYMEYENKLVNSARNDCDTINNITHPTDHSSRRTQDTEEKEHEEEEHTDNSTILLHSAKEHLTSLLVCACELGITLTASFLVVR